MPDDILISELSNAPQIDDSAVFPLTQDNGGSPATFKATMSQMSGKIGEGTTFANLKTGQKDIIGSINQTVSNFAPDFSTSSTYDVDDCVLYEGILYKCITAITTAGAWDSTKWTTIKAVDVGSGGGGGSSTLAGLTDTNITSPSNGQVLKYDSASGKWINASESDGSWTDITGTLTAGQTSITLSNSVITTSSTIEIFTDADIDYNSISVTTGSVTITFDAQASNLGVKVRVS